jgi:general secretion pathway protein A
MYENFYGLSASPFQLTPDARFFYESTVHRQAMSYLIYGLHHGEGFIIITGEVGAGKTILVDNLLSTINQSHLAIAKIVTTQLTEDDLLHLVAAGFGIAKGGLPKGELLQHITDFVLAQQRNGKRALLIVDEAQNLSFEALEELRMLSNIVVGKTMALQSFLLGQPQFRATLGSPRLEQLRQRVTAAHHLGPLSEAETRAYIEHRLRRADWKGDPQFTEDSFPVIYRHTGGVPRQINTLCSRLLLFGFMEELHTLSAVVVETVANDLRQEMAAVTLDHAPEACAPLAVDALTRNANTNSAEVPNQNVADGDAGTAHSNDEVRALLAENTARALLAENETLRQTVMRLSAENDAVREQAARRLTHHNLGGVKQRRPARFALAIAFGIALAAGIVAFLSRQDIARLGWPSLRPGTMASSGQQAPARSGGQPAETERRGNISGRPSSAARVTPETMPQPPPQEAAVDPLKGSASQLASAPVAAPDQTAQAPEAPQSTSLPTPEKEQATAPGTSASTSSPLVQSTSEQRLSAAEIAALVTRGDAFLSAGDIVSARLFYERAADGGDGDAALRLGTTFDPAFLSRTSIRGGASDRTQAVLWYRRAVDLGNSAAQEGLRHLEQPLSGATGSPAH